MAASSHEDSSRTDSPYAASSHAASPYDSPHVASSRATSVQQDHSRTGASTPSRDLVESLEHITALDSHADLAHTDSRHPESLHPDSPCATLLPVTSPQPGTASKTLLESIEQHIALTSNTFISQSSALQAAIDQHDAEISRIRSAITHLEAQCEEEERGRMAKQEELRALSVQSRAEERAAVEGAIELLQARLGEFDKA
jgi:hypothetical protein